MCLYYLTSVFGWNLTNIARVLACVLSWPVAVLRYVDLCCVVLGWISGRWDVGMWTGLGWPRIGTGGGRL